MCQSFAVLVLKRKQQCSVCYIETDSWEPEGNQMKSNFFFYLMTAQVTKFKLPNRDILQRF